MTAAATCTHKGACDDVDPPEAGAPLDQGRLRDNPTDDSFCGQMKALWGITPALLNQPCRNILNVLLTYANNKEEGNGIFISVKTLEDATGLSHTRVHEYLNLLKAKGYVVDDGSEVYRGARIKRRRIGYAAMRRDCVSESLLPSKDRNSEGKFTRSRNVHPESPVFRTLSEASDLIESPVNGIIEIGGESPVTGILNAIESPVNGVIESPVNAIQSPVRGTQIEYINQKYKSRRLPAPTPANCGPDRVSKISDSADRAVERWNKLAAECGLTLARGLPEARRRKLQARLKDCGGLEGWNAALDEIRDSSFLRGVDRQGRPRKPSPGHTSPFRVDIDWLLRPNNFPKVLEGGWRDDAAASAVSGWDKLDAELTRMGV